MVYYCIPASRLCLSFNTLFISSRPEYVTMKPRPKLQPFRSRYNSSFQEKVENMFCLISFSYFLLKNAIPLSRGTVITLTRSSRKIFNDMNQRASSQESRATFACLYRSLGRFLHDSIHICYTAITQPRVVRFTRNNHHHRYIICVRPG